MLTGKLVRTKAIRNRIAPQYIDAADPQWARVAASLLDIFREAQGLTREELEAAVRDLLGDHPGQVVHQGLAKLLEDRCEFESDPGVDPEALRASAFRRAAAARLAGTLDRDAVLSAAAAEFGIEPVVAERGLFADLKGEQRLVEFADLTPPQLLDRYNVALAQAVLVRATHVEATVRFEPPPRLRALVRAVKFHRLIARFEGVAEGIYVLHLDGPLSLFQATQKYGMQLAVFLPSLLLCRDFDLKATVKWGPARKDKVFTLSSNDKLRSHLADHGQYVPREMEAFAESFRKSVSEWDIEPVSAALPVGNTFWVPDFRLTQKATGKTVLLEVAGFWRRLQVEKHYRTLKASLSEPFLLAVSEQGRADADDGEELPPEVYRFKAAPLPARVAERAAALV